MGLLPKNKIKKILLPVTVLAVLLFVGAGTAKGFEQITPGRKVIVLLLDGLSLSDLKSYPNLKSLAASSGLGLINTRTRSLTDINRASGYLTIGMGVRVQVQEPLNGYEVKRAPLRSGGRDNLNQLRNVDAAALNKMMSREYPNYAPGKIGELAKDQGIKVSLVGNSDTDRVDNDATLLVMDKSGAIPLANTGSGLLVKDPDFAWGVRTDPGQLLSCTLEAWESSDVIFIDFGDTARVSAAADRGLYGRKEMQNLKSRALGNADFFLGRLMGSIDWQITALIVVSPTPPMNEPSRINNSLAPVIIYEKNRLPGVLSSETTRRDGLAANIDMGPTIFDMLGYDSSQMNFLGEKIAVQPGSDNFSKISHNMDQYVQIKTSRYIVHGVYVILLLAALVSLYRTMSGLRTAEGARFMRALALAVIAWPAATLLVTAAARMQGYYLYLVLAGVITAGLGVLLSRTVSGTLAGMGWLSLSTALFLAIDTLNGLKFLHNTPLGFNDVFSGGRYYGMNNDCMGILLGSTVFAMFYWFQRTGLKKPLRVILGMFWLIIMIITQTPGLGANVGGTIAAMTTGVVALMILAFDRPLPKRRVVVTVALVFIIELGIAYFDYRSGGQTHAGKVMGALISEGFGPKFLEVLKSKLGLFAVMLVLPPWNFLFGAQLYICYLMKKKRHIADFLYHAHPDQLNSFEAIFYSGLVAFVFNDTGVIATSIIFTYLTMPLAAILSANTDLCTAKPNI